MCRCMSVLPAPFDDQFHVAESCELDSAVDEIPQQHLQVTSHLPVPCLCVPCKCCEPHFVTHLVTHLVTHFVTTHSAATAVRQDARCVPADSGEVLCWSGRSLHYGGRASARAECPRVALAVAASDPKFEEPAMRTGCQLIDAATGRCSARAVTSLS